jgi:ABC-type multidrug transport system permease subunit
MNGVGNVVGMGLAALGGCWWPIEITPAWMQSLAIALPTGWAMDALHRLISFGYGGTAALPHLAAILIASAILGWLGARTFRFQ